MATKAGRFLPGVPGGEIEAIFARAPGNEIETGKFDNPESSACLERFAVTVADDEVAFVSCSWRKVLETWKRHENDRVRAHGAVVGARFAP